MIKWSVVVLGLMIAPLFAWSMLPVLVCVAVLSPFLLGLATLIVVCTRRGSATKAPAIYATRALPEPAPVSDPPVGLQPHAAT